jgi:cytochrome bd-type quinol oxidase subunit 2
MFLAMLFSTRAGLEALDKNGNPRKLVIWTTGLLFVGGMILGPLVQKYAFGALWTGFPFGFDLTDNKTLIAMLGWIAALIAGRKGKPARVWVLGASVLLLIVYLIPHSLLGSQLDYSKLNPPTQ